MEELQNISDRLNQLVNRFRCEMVSISGEIEKVIREVRDMNRVADSWPCEYCGVDFRGWNRKQRFCSRKCQGKWVWEERQRNKAEKNELYLQSDSAHN